MSCCGVVELGGIDGGNAIRYARHLGAPRAFLMAGEGEGAVAELLLSETGGKQGCRRLLGI